MAQTVVARVAGRAAVRDRAGSRRTGTPSRRELLWMQRHWLRRNWRVLAGGVALTGLVAAVTNWALPQPFGLYAAGCIVAAGVWWTNVTMREAGGMSGQQVAISGDAWTVEELVPLQRAGWKIVNRVTLDHDELDHVVIGPGGHFAIESEFRSDWPRAAASFPSWAAAAQRNAHDLRSKLHRGGCTVTPVVVLWGPSVTKLHPAPFVVDGVTFCAGPHLRAVLDADGADQLVTPHQIADAYAALAHYVATRHLCQTERQGLRALAVS